MQKEARFLVDVGMKNLPFPINVISRVNPGGQPTVANISIDARIMHEFEACWIDKFIEILHKHRGNIGTKTLRVNIMDYLKGLKATMVKVNFEYPFFIEKITPVSKKKCLVKYLCNYTAKISVTEDSPNITFDMAIPVITTYPQSNKDITGGLFGQLTTVRIKVESKEDIFPEDLVDIVDQHALSPIYSFLTKEDQLQIIKKVHAEYKTSVMMIDEIKEELSHNANISWYSISCSNFGMLHPYATVIEVEKSMWVPLSDYSDDEI